MTPSATPLHRPRTVAGLVVLSTTTLILFLLVVGLFKAFTALPSAQTFYDSLAWRTTGKLLFSATAPTVTSAGTSPSVTASNGAATFIVNVGTGGTATAIVMAMPTASTGWTCISNDITASAAAVAGIGDRQTASTTTSVTVEHYTVSTGAALAYTASDLVRFICAAY